MASPSVNVPPKRAASPKRAVKSQHRHSPRLSGSCLGSRAIRAAAAFCLALIVHPTSASASLSGTDGENPDPYSPIGISYPGSTELKVGYPVVLRPQSTCRVNGDIQTNDETEKHWGFQDIQSLSSVEHFPEILLLNPRRGWPKGLKFIRQDGSIRGTPIRAGRWHIITVFVNAYCRDSDQRSRGKQPVGEDVTVEFDMIIAPSDK